MKKLYFLFMTFIFVGYCENSVNVEVPSIESHEWKLISFGYTKMAVPQDAFIGLKDGRYFGNAGCNGMGGKYILKGKEIQFKTGMLTMMACPDMSLEAKFTTALQSVDSYEIKDKTLVLLHDMHPVLNFIKK